MCIPHKEMFFVLFCHCFLPHKCRFSMFRCSGFSPIQPVVSRQGTPQIQKSVGGGGWEQQVEGKFYDVAGFIRPT